MIENIKFKFREFLGLDNGYETLLENQKQTLTKENQGLILEEKQTKISYYDLFLFYILYIELSFYIYYFKYKFAILLVIMYIRLALIILLTIVTYLDNIFLFFENFINILIDVLQHLKIEPTYCLGSDSDESMNSYSSSNSSDRELIYEPFFFILQRSMWENLDASSHFNLNQNINDIPQEPNNTNVTDLSGDTFVIKSFIQNQLINTLQNNSIINYQGQPVPITTSSGVTLLHLFTEFNDVFIKDLINLNEEYSNKVLYNHYLYNKHLPFVSLFKNDITSIQPNGVASSLLYKINYNRDIETHIFSFLKEPLQDTISRDNYINESKDFNILLRNTYKDFQNKGNTLESLEDTNGNINLTQNQLATILNFNSVNYNYNHNNNVLTRFN